MTVHHRVQSQQKDYFRVNQLMTASPSEGHVPMGPPPTHTHSTACWNPSIGQRQSWSQQRADKDVTRPGGEVPQTNRHGPQKSPLPTGLETLDGGGGGKQGQSQLPAAPSAAVSHAGKQCGLSIHLPSWADSLCSRVYTPVDGRNFNDGPPIFLLPDEELLEATSVLRNRGCARLFPLRHLIS